MHANSSLFLLFLLRASTLYLVSPFSATVSVGMGNTEVTFQADRLCPTPINFSSLLTVKYTIRQRQNVSKTNEQLPHDWQLPQSGSEMPICWKRNRLLRWMKGQTSLFGPVNRVCVFVCGFVKFKQLHNTDLVVLFLYRMCCWFARGRKAKSFSFLFHQTSHALERLHSLLNMLACLHSLIMSFLLHN